MRDAWVPGQRGPCLRSVAGDDVEHAVRQASVTCQARQQDRPEGSLLGCFEHAAVARRDGGGDGAGADLQRVVPRHDVAGDADRLPQGVGDVVGRVRHGVPVKRFSRSCVELEVAGGDVHVGVCLLHRLAGVAALDGGQGVALGGDERGEPAQHPPAHGWRGRRPLAERALCCSGSSVDLCCRTRDNLGECLARGGVGHVDPLVAGDVLAADDSAVPLHRTAPSGRTVAAHRPGPYRPNSSRGSPGRKAPVNCELSPISRVRASRASPSASCLASQLASAAGTSPPAA